MSRKKYWRWLSLAVVMAMLLAIAPSFTIAQENVTQAEATPQSEREVTRAEDYLIKLHPDLRNLVLTTGPAMPAEAGPLAEGVQKPILIQVIAKAGTLDLSPYFVDGKVRVRPAIGKGDNKIQIYAGEVLPSALPKIAEQSLVQSIFPVVLERDAVPDIYPADDTAPEVKAGPDDWAKLRDNAEKLREGSLPWSEAKAYGDGLERPPIEDWFEVLPEGPHKAQAAWDRGYMGEGVTVAVLDDGTDFGHSDLIGTQKIYSSTVNSEYNGWPVVFSPFSMFLYWLNPLYVTFGQPGVGYVDTSEMPTLSSCGAGISCFSYEPLIDWIEWTTARTYVMSDSMSLSGVAHVGTHPDFNLRDSVWGERPAVLVVDPNTAGVYDTVYVDLDNDYDFRDEKPLTRADTTSAATLAATYNDMVAYRDLNADGISDVSGGLLYFIADGATPIPVSDWMYGGLIPGNGALVAFTGGGIGGGDSHGTRCASNVVGQGVVNGLVPAFRDLPGDGKPAAAVVGAAPEAKLVDISDIYWNHTSSTVDGYLFAAVGYDAIDQTGFDLLTSTSGHTDTDAIQVNSNSYGRSNVDNDGWDYRGQLVSHVQRWYAPYQQFLFSTGNGAPGYGTTAPPSGATSISIGASTQYGSTGWDSITDTNQIMFDDMAVWSNRGPSAREGAGVDVVANGARGGGDLNLNAHLLPDWGVLDGNLGWATWGGTSRSAPHAMGNLALIYQAYKDANGVWPTYAQARALIMATATDIDYDVFVQGAGSVNADRGTLVASGEYGVYVTDPDWAPGDFRGDDWPGFAHVVYPGDTWNKTFTVYNDSAAAINVNIDDGTPTLIDTETFTFTVTPEMFAAKDPDNFFRAPQWIIPLTATPAKIAANSWWDHIEIPADTELMIVRMRYPYDQFDADGDYLWDNRFRLAVYNWKDINGNDKVWTDTNSNGVVNFVSTTDRTQIDMGYGDGELDWDDPATEIERWEYGRFDYARLGGNVQEQWIRDPLGRMHDGLFLGLQQYDASTVEETDWSFQIDFYKYEDIPWLSTDVTSLNVPAGGTATFQGTVNVPNDMPPGDYEAAIKVYDPGTGTYDEHTTVVPVVLNVAADFTPGLTLGGMDSYTYDADKPYNNGLVRGEFDWTWRAESGDWRFFYVDIPDSTYDSDTHVLVKDEWDGVAPQTDIDTVVLGPSPTELGSDWYSFDEWGITNFYGPYVLDTIANSPNTNQGGGIWTFDTSSGANEDWVNVELPDLGGGETGGLYEVLQHNVLFEGDKFNVVFTKTLGTLWEDVHSYTIDTDVRQGEVGDVTVEASLALNGLVVDAYLIDEEQTLWVGEPLDFVNANTNEWLYDFDVADGVEIELFTSSPDISDIDLFLYYWDGSAWVQRGGSTTADANEYIQILNPEDGQWRIGVNNWSGPAGHFNLTLTVRTRVAGLSVTGVPVGPVAANTPTVLTIHYDYPFTPGTHYGAVLVGPPEAPALKEIPVTINYVGPTFDTSYKDATAEVALGEAIVYEVHVTNTGGTLADVTFTDPIPTGTTYAGHLSPPPSHFEYNAVDNQMEWSGHIAPSDEIVFEFAVAVDNDADLWYETITNTATIEWGSEMLELTATTSVVPPYKHYLPAVLKGY